MLSLKLLLLFPTCMCTTSFPRNADSLTEPVVQVDVFENGIHTTRLNASIGIVEELLKSHRQNDSIPVGRLYVDRRPVERLLHGEGGLFEITDHVHGTKLIFSLEKLKIQSIPPKSDVVIEIYEKGRKSFSLRFPSREDGSGLDSVTTAGYKANDLGEVMPALWKKGGVVRVADLLRDSELWIFMGRKGGD